MTDVTFTKAQSDNLPKIDTIMMALFFARNTAFVSAEFRGCKANRSSRENYGDNAIGYVQVKRNDGICTVKAKITPEHKIRKKAYNVTLVCNENQETIDSCECEDCPASQGGCKHALAFVSWLHRRSEEPPKTSVECYWKRSRMAEIGTTLKFIKAKDLGSVPNMDLPIDDGSFIRELVEESTQLGVHKSTMSKYLVEPTALQNLSLHNMAYSFFNDNIGTTANEFIHYCQKCMSSEACHEASQQTISQAECALWHQLRYARVTASKLYEVAHCKTLEGSLTESLLGAKIFDSNALQRGRKLEKKVLKVVEKARKIKFSKCGFILSNEQPIFGASPDALGEHCIVEVKCPSKESTVKMFIKNGKPSPKSMAQMQMQMHFAKKTSALYCVANYDFEVSKKVFQYEIIYNNALCEELMAKATEFWSKVIFNKLKL